MAVSFVLLVYEYFPMYTYFCLMGSHTIKGGTECYTAKSHTQLISHWKSCVIYAYHMARHAQKLNYSQELPDTCAKLNYSQELPDTCAKLNYSQELPAKTELQLKTA